MGKRQNRGGRSFSDVELPPRYPQPRRVVEGSAEMPSDAKALIPRHFRSFSFAVLRRETARYGEMAPRPGLEPGTCGLTVRRSTD